LKKNSFQLGIVIGILAPFAGVLIFYLWKAGSNPFLYFLEVVLENKSLLTAVISFALLANALVFTWAVNTDKDKTARGIFFITLIMMVPLIVYKIFM